MKISKQWLDNFFDAPLPDAQKVADALTFHAFEIDGVETVGSDSVLDVKITANRGHDCLSHRGIAKELSAILKLPLSKDPFKRPIDLSKKTNVVTVTISDTNLCKRYIAGYVKGVKVGPSPEWLKVSLEAIGQRSINNVVDATNLVMFNTGQPLHAFDAAKLGSFDIGVRLAKQGEKIIALDTKEYTVSDSMLLITAGDAPVGIAGVKGGMPAAVDETTQDIVIESANFDGVSVRKTAQGLKLRTDASNRFEQVISPELAAVGMQQAIDLILAIAGGEVDGFVDEYPSPQTISPVSVSVSFVNKVLGTTLSDKNVADVFTRLQFSYTQEGDVFTVMPPFERLDILIPEDLVEEVGRIVGYDAVHAQPLPVWKGGVTVSQRFYAAEKLREQLISQGYSEVFTSVFSDVGERIVANKVDGVRPYLRNSLVPGVRDAVAKNVLNRVDRVRIFEIGTIWKNGKEDMVAVWNDSESGPRVTNDRSLEIPTPVPENYEILPVSTTERYVPFSKYPFISRDIAFWVPAEVSSDSARDIIRAAGGPLLQEHIVLFDEFKKGERISYAFRLTFQSHERTLTDEEVHTAMESVSSALKAQGFEVR